MEVEKKIEGALTAVKIYYLAEICGLLTHEPLTLVRSTGIIKNHVNKLRQSAFFIKTSLLVDNIKPKQGAGEDIFNETSDLYLLINNAFKLGIHNLDEVNEFMKDRIQQKE